MTSVACMMQRGGRPWFRASRMACSSVTLRVQLLDREEKHKVTRSVCIFIRFSPREWTMLNNHNAGYCPCYLGMQFCSAINTCIIYLPISHTLYYQSLQSVLDTIKSSIVTINTNSFTFSTCFHGYECNRRKQKKKARHTQTHFAPLDTLSWPSHPSGFTFAHLLANESFHVPLKCHSRRAATSAQHRLNNKTSLL